ncbi:multidrug resistance protein 4 [Russula compacta]|nr:multidrug resistance protein 4 [Russula compacta]
MEVSEISSNPPTSSEGCTTVAATVDKASGHVILEDNWAIDTRNPRNWPLGKKWAAVIVVSLYTVVAAIVSSMMAPALPDIADRFHIVSDTEVALTLSIFLLSFAISPLFYAPLSEMYGRTWVLHINNLLFILFNLGCAFSPTKNTLIAFRFLCGWTGGSPIAIGAGIVGDVFSAEERAWAMAVYTFGPVAAPAISPTIGGYMTETVGWKYIFVLVAGVSAIASVIGMLMYRESYAPVIRRRIAQEMTETGIEVEKQSHLPPVHEDRLDYLFINLKRPFVLLTRSITCFVLSVYMAFIYGIYYLMITTIPGTSETSSTPSESKWIIGVFSGVYHFGSAAAGLAYLGVGMGFTFATVCGGHFGNKIYRALVARNGSQGEPEMRVPAILFGSLSVPIGLFWYGWSAEAKMHWIMPIIGTFIFGFGVVMTLLPIHLYLVDTFTYAASALSAATLSRSMLAFIFPLFGTQMFENLGLGVGNSLLAAIAIVMGITFPALIWFYGERLRARSSLTK